MRIELSLNHNDDKIYFFKFLSVTQTTMTSLICLCSVVSGMRSLVTAVRLEPSSRRLRLDLIYYLHVTVISYNCFRDLHLTAYFQISDALLSYHDAIFLK